MSRLFRFALVLLLMALGCAGCATTDEAGEGEETAGTGETPHRATWPAYTSSGVRRNQTDGIGFEDTQWELTKPQLTAVRALAKVMKVQNERVIVAGGAEAASPEYARQLGQQRALSVMAALIDEGIPANNIMTVSYGRDLPGRGGDRVEFGFIPNGEGNP